MAPNDPEGPRAIGIVGMHRSGTSVLAQALELRGAYLGSRYELLAPDRGNPAGYFERSDLVFFHARVLRALGRRWHSVQPLPDEWSRSPMVSSFRDELGALIGRAFAGRSLWAWKDPRSSLLLEMWDELLRERGIPMSLVMIVRHPRDVAESLRKLESRGVV